MASTTHEMTVTNGHSHDEEHEEPGLLILYGSETGNAQDVAERIGGETIKLSLKTRLMAMDAYPLDDLMDEPLVIFVCSTTGSGVEPRNMTPLWRALLRSDLPPDLLDHLHFSVFGLGDSGYERFNWAAKKLQRRLLSLGAVEVVERGDADDQDFYGIDTAYNSWMAKFTSILSTLYPDLQAPSPTTTPAHPPPRIELKALDGVAALTHKMDGAGIAASGKESELVEVELKSMTRITREDWYQDVRHIEFESNDDLLYEPGDIAVLYPENAPDDIEWLITRMGWEEHADVTYSIRTANEDWPLPQHFPTSATLRDLLTEHLDISAVPRRPFFETIRHFTPDEREKEKLDEFCSKEGQDELHTYATRPRRTMLEVLSEFRSVRIPLEYIMNVFPPIRPRRFSIASASKAHPKQIHLCVAIVRYKTNLKAPRKGLCTSWLTHLSIGARIRIGLDQGTMKLPSDLERPIVMVGPGTGVAPLRAFLEERVRGGAEDNVLYFGCRSKSADCHYHDEWKAFEARREVVCRIAASRDQESKVYVQHLMKQDVNLLIEKIVKGNGHVYVCGSSNQMPKAVRKAVEFALAQQEGWDEDVAVKYVKTMELDGRWGEECWS